MKAQTAFLGSASEPGSMNVRYSWGPAQGEIAATWRYEKTYRFSAPDEHKLVSAGPRTALRGTEWGETGTRVGRAQPPVTNLLCSLIPKSLKFLSP